MIDIGNLFFSGDLVHIVGIGMACRGRQCEAHSPLPCGSSLRTGSWVTFHLVSLVDEGLPENEIEVRLIQNGNETCRVGFLQRHYIPHFERYVGKVAQVREVWTAGDDSAAQRKMVHHNHGCCVAGIMGSEKIEGLDSSFDHDSDGSDSE